MSRHAYKRMSRSARTTIAVVTAVLTVVVTVVLTLQLASAGTRSNPEHAARRSASPAPAATADTSPTGARSPAVSPSKDPAGLTTVRYKASGQSVINPERGFAHLTRCDEDDLSEAELRDYRQKEGISLIWCVFYLAGYQDKELDSTVLRRLDSQFKVVRSAGLKMVLRFAYTEDESGDDASPAMVLRHIAALRPHLRDNSDVIVALQAGFVGAWGEWYYTQHFGDKGKTSSTDLANRYAVLQALIEAVGRSRTVQVRTPAIKRGFFGPKALTKELAYGGTGRARVGFHNDCFLASSSDMGTYTDPATEKPYLAAETTYLAMGGETCATNPPRTSCTVATRELAQFHWTYLNADYHPQVLAGWRTEGCLSTIARKLGYRLVLQQGSYPDTVARSAGLPVRISLRNDGWSAPVNPRRVELVLRGTNGTVTRRIPLTGVDPRTWYAGQNATIALTVGLPSDLPTGKYRLALALPDSATTLAARPEYAVQTANTGLWDAAKGWNDLNHVVTVTN